MFLDAPSRHSHFRKDTFRLARLQRPGLYALAFSAGLIVGAFVLRPHIMPVRVQMADRTQPQDGTTTVWERNGNPVIRQPVEIMRTIDGDTFEARVHLWPGLDMTTRVRLRGIDAPELKARCAGEGQMAQEASTALKALLDEGGVTIFNVGPDKYNGRVVADAATRATPNVSAALLNAGHVRRYAGGHREGWCR
ncbi:MAG: thermonuclease family protein [Xanthobacteraceae bacterium]|nr:thermonuclease family protein [Xanthobacteraceae bacterium]